MGLDALGLPAPDDAVDLEISQIVAARSQTSLA